jgi:hypothetical protein
MRIVAGTVLAAALGASAPAAAQSFGVASFFAAVNSQGVTALSSGVESSKKVGPGRYVITFTRPVTSCTFVASVRGPIGGQVSTAGPGGNAHRVSVFTFSTSGSAANRNFSLIAFCAP